MRGDLAARELVEARAADQHAPCRFERLRLGEADGRDLGDRCRSPIGTARGGCPALARPSAWQTARRPCSIDDRRERRRADHVADRVDVRHRGAAVRVDRRGARARSRRARPPRGPGRRRWRRGRARRAASRARPRVRSSSAWCTTDRRPSHATCATRCAADVAAAVALRSAPTKRSVSSASTNASGRGAGRSSSPRTPRPAKIEAYSHAITPPPSTVERARQIDQRQDRVAVENVLVVDRDLARRADASRWR